MTTPFRAHAALRACGGIVAIVLIVGAGCREEEPVMPPAGPTPVKVSLPVERVVAPSETASGRLEAVESVEVRARVSGYLVKVDFRDGAKVNKGDLLFEIDPRPYEATLARCEADVAKWQAQLAQTTANLARTEKLRPSGAATQEELDQAVADRGVAEASLHAAEADVASAKLNLDYTKIEAPISGRISKAEVTEGNLISVDSTLLTTIVSDDPIYCYFDVDERTVLRIREQIQQGKLRSPREVPDVKIWMELANETGYPHEGVIDFVDNRIDTTTGTIRVRGVFPNPRGSMSPGFFTKVKILVAEPAPALLVTERALISELGQKYLLLVNENDEVEKRAVTVGQLDAGLRVIETGITASDRVIVIGQQRVREGMKVAPEMIPMPSSAPPAAKPEETPPEAPAVPAPAAPAAPAEPAVPAPTPVPSGTSP